MLIIMQTKTNITQRVLGKRITLGLVAVILLAVGCSPSVCAQWSFTDSWKVHPEYKGPVPNKSDVIFSTRFKRQNAATVARAYGATRIEWVYSTDPDFFNELKLVTPWVGGSLNSSIPLKDDLGVAKDFNGKPIVAPWMKSWGAKWITTTDPNTRSELLSMAKAYLKLGAKSIQFDGPLLEYATSNWGGEFSETTLDGFKQYLRSYKDKKLLKMLGLDQPNINYRQYLMKRFGIRSSEEYARTYRNIPSTVLWNDYLKQSVQSFFNTFRHEIDRIAGFHVPLSMNLPLKAPDNRYAQYVLLPYLDYAMVETDINDIESLILQAATYRAFGVGQVPSIRPKSERINRAVISLFYALGAQPLVPWDVYINRGKDRKPKRFFGAPEVYADIYKFVSTKRHLFDGFEQLSQVGILIPIDKYRRAQILGIIKQLISHNIPFHILPYESRTRRILFEPERLKYVRNVIYAGPKPDLGSDISGIIKRNNINIRSMVDMKSSDIDDLSPFYDADKIGPAIFRGDTKNDKRFVIHMLNSSMGGELKCKNKITIKKRLHDFNHLSYIKLHSMKLHNLDKTASLNYAVSEEGITIHIPECSDWDIIEFMFDDKSNV